MTTALNPAREILKTIADSIDEKTISNINDSFIEMEGAVIHAVINGKDMYYRVLLILCGEEEYGK